VSGRRHLAVAVGALALAALWALPALACPVCYGEAEGGVIDGTRMSVAFLGGLVYLVLFGGVGMVLVARRRALRSGDPRHGLHLVAGADGGGAADHDPTSPDPRHDDGRRAPAEETSER
jgi:hypothetical protein